MTMAPGRITGLAGPNGSGKTMLMRTLVGLVQAHLGQRARHGPRPLGVGDKTARPTKTEKAAPHEYPRSAGSLKDQPFWTATRAYAICSCLHRWATRQLQSTRARPSRPWALTPTTAASTEAFPGHEATPRHRGGQSWAPPTSWCSMSPPTPWTQTGCAWPSPRFERRQIGEPPWCLPATDAAVLHELANEVWYLAEGHIDGHEELNVAGSCDPKA